MQGTVFLGNGGEPSGRAGRNVGRVLTLNNVLYSPRYLRSTISVPQILQMGYHVTYSGNFAVIDDSSRSPIVTFSKVDGVDYVLDDVRQVDH